MADVVKNIENSFTEFNVVVDEIMELDRKLQVLKSAVAELSYQPPKAEACDEPKSLAYEPDFQYWWTWNKNHDNKNFAGFVECDGSKYLVAGKRYGFAIGPTALIGDRLQLVVKLDAFDEKTGEDDFERPVGILIEEYIVGSDAFKEMAIAVFAPIDDILIEVDMEQIPEAFGTICLKECDGKLHLDWHTCEVESSPISRARDFNWLLTKRMNE